MGKFRIQPHGRLAEWVAEERGFFEEEELDYVMVGRPGPPPALEQNVPASEDQVMRGAFESMEVGRSCEVSAACHWAVSMAASARHGRMWAHAYSVTPGGIMVPPDSPIRSPEDLRSAEIGVGYHSGSHFSTLQALEPLIAPQDVKLRFIGGPGQRRDMLIDGEIGAVNVFGMDKDIVEQFGCRKVLDTTFMIGFLITGEPDHEDVRRYFNALQRAQREIDAQPEQYKHYFERHLPERYRGRVNVRLFSPGERIVFEPYTREVWERTHRWMEDLQLFSEDQLGRSGYREAMLI